MNKKNGITLVMLTITLIIMALIATITIVSMNSSIKFYKYTTWANEIMYIQDIVDEKLNTEYLMDETIGTIYLDVSLGTGEQFESETINDSKLQLLILDLDKLGVVNTVYGNLNHEKDVYALSETTGRVYYVAGIKMDNEIYYTLTHSLLDMFGIENTEKELSTVIFKPNKLFFSNEPIVVTVKVPTNFSNVSITTSNSNVVVSDVEIKDGANEYQVNTNSVEGNYIITVNYINGGSEFSVKYEVNGYDVEAPIINADISAEDIVKVEVTDTSGIKVLKYEYGIVNEDEAKEYFETGGRNLNGGKFKVADDIVNYTVYARDNAGNYAVKFVQVSGVAQVASGVPIPRGFVPSPYVGENTKESGFVIYQLTDSELQSGVVSLPQEEQYTSWTTRNQYVWIPVESSMFGNEFVRSNFSTSSVVISNTLGENFWEVRLDGNNMPSDIDESNTYLSQKTVQEAKAMYASVKKYGGFYVARYEAGINTQRTSNTTLLKGSNVYSMMNKIPYNFIIWGNSLLDETNGAVEVARSIYPVDSDANTTGVVSTLIYGVQWDAILNWYLDTGALTETEINDTTNYGNYNNRVITTYTEINTGAQYSPITNNVYTGVTTAYTKNASTCHIFSTGALKAAKINNIYDMGGNMAEWTMEGSIDGHVRRGGNYYNEGAAYPMVSRVKTVLDDAQQYSGFRVALYIK